MKSQKQKATPGCQEHLTRLQMLQGVRARCDADIRSLCAKQREQVDRLTVTELFGSSKRGLVLTCLKKNMTSLQGSCQREMRRVVRVQAWDAHLDPTFKRACSADAKEHCPSSAPQEAHQCMREKIDLLSEKCQEAELLQGVLVSRDVSLKTPLMVKCRQAVSQVGFGVPPRNGQLLRCLQDGMNAEGFPQGCRQALAADIKASNHDWRMKYGVSRICLVDLDRLCPAEKKIGGGRALTCLKMHIANITVATCKLEVTRSIRFGMHNFTLALDTWQACAEDVRR